MVGLWFHPPFYAIWRPMSGDGIPIKTTLDPSEAETLFPSFDFLRDGSGRIQGRGTI